MKARLSAGKVRQTILTTVYVLLSSWKHISVSGKIEKAVFNYHTGLLKLVQAHFIVRIDRVSGFQHCGGLVKLLQACLIARKDRDSSFHHWGVAE